MQIKLSFRLGDLEMKKQFLVEIEYEENEPMLVTDLGIEVTIENMMYGYKEGLIRDGWTVNVSELN